MAEGPRGFIDVEGLGPIPLLPGESAKDAIKRVNRAANSDPRMRDRILSTIQKGGSKAVEETGLSMFRSPGERRRAKIAGREGAPVGEGELGGEGFFTRFDMARSDNFLEKARKLERAFPKAEIRLGEVGPGGEPTLLIRMPNEPMFREVNSADVFSLGDVAEFLGTMLTEDIVGEILGMVFARKLGGGKALSRGGRVLRDIVGGSLGAAAGEGVKSAVEASRDLELSDREDIAQRVVVSGLLAGTGIFAFEGLARLVKLPRTSLDFARKRPTPEAANVMDVAEDMNLPFPSLDSWHPRFKSIAQQARGTQVKLESFDRDKLHKTLEFLHQEIQNMGDISKLDTNTLDKAFNMMVSKLSRVSGEASPNALRDMTKSVMDGMNAFSQLAMEREVRKYSYALKNYAGASFNIAHIQREARGMLYGTRGPGKKGRSTVAVGDPVEGEFKSALERLVSLNENVATVRVKRPSISDEPLEFNPLQILIETRGTFYRVANDLNAAPNTRRLAGDVHRLLTEVMMKPDGVSGAAVNAWRAAANATTFKENILDKMSARLLMQKKNPEELARSLLTPNRVSFTVVRNMRRVMGAERFADFQRAYKDALMLRPDLIETRFKRWADDPRGLDILLKPAEKRELILLSQSYKKFTSNSALSLARNRVDAAERVMGLLNSANITELKSIVRAAGGRNNPKIGALKSGIIVRLMQGAHKIDKGVDVIDPAIFLKSFERLRDKGVMDVIFTPRELARMKDIEKYVSFLPAKMGAGEGIRKAQVASEATITPVSILNPGRTFRGRIALARDWMISMLIRSDKAQRFIVARPRPLPDFKRMRLIGGALGAAASNLEEDLVTAYEAGDIKEINLRLRGVQKGRRRQGRDPFGNPVRPPQPRLHPGVRQ